MVHLESSHASICTYCYKSKSILVFDVKGRFKGEKKFHYAGKDISNSPFFPLDDGKYWLIDDDFRSKESCSIHSNSFRTRFHLFNNNGVLIATHSLPGRWEGCLPPGHQSYIQTQNDSEIIIHEFDRESGKHAPYFQVAFQALRRELKLKTIQLNGWAVENKGRIVLLVEKGSTGGIVAICSPDGLILNHWEVQPDPVTSVSYINGMRVGHDGTIYVTHSSWEVSSAMENCGSIALYTPEGRFLRRIKKGVGYVDEITVLPGGVIATNQGGDRLITYSPAGHPILSWMVTPPPPGMTWEQRERILKEIPGVNARTPIEELILARRVCEYKDEDRIEKLFFQRGPDAIRPVTDALLALSRTNDSGGFFWIASSLWEKYPAQAVPYLEERYQKGSTEEKKLLAVFLGKNKKYQLPGIKNLLGEIAAGEGFGFLQIEAEEILKKIDPIALLAANLNEARINQKGDDLDWGIRNTIYENFSQAFPLLEKIILDPKDTLRPAIRRLIIEVREEIYISPLNGKTCGSVPQEIITRTSGWLRSGDPFVRDTAVLALTTFGVPGHQQEVVNLVKNSSAHLPLALVAFQGLGKTNIQWVEPWGAELADFIVEFYRMKRREGRTCAERFFSIRSKTAQERCLKALGSADIPVRTKEAILWGMALEDKSILPQTWSMLKNNPHWFSSSPELVSPYSAVLADGIRREADHAPEISRRFFTLIDRIEKHMDHLFSRGPVAQNNKWNEGLKNTLDYMEDAVCAGDASRLGRLMSKPWLSDDARSKLFPLLEKTGLPDSLIPQMEKYLDDDAFALAAARLLCLKGNEKALRVLIDRGLKRSGSYSFQRFEKKHFQSFGKKGVSELMKLLDYPDSGPQMWARHILSSMKAPEFYPRLKREYDVFIKTKSYSRNMERKAIVIGCMELYGHDTIPDIVQIPLVKTGAIPNFFMEDPTDFKARLQKYILKETDIKKAEILTDVLSGNSDNDEEEKILDDLAKKHPVLAIQDMLKKKLKEKKEQ